MRCPTCAFENPESIKFCNECGASLQQRCPSCGFENAPRSKFCGECGTPLVMQGSSAHTIVHTIEADNRRLDSNKGNSMWEGNGDPEAERRQLTVMFCDLVGSTALSEQLDPEEFRDVVRTYQGACAEVIDRFEGYIAQYLGDGLLVYFGYPLAHEDDGQRAVKAGLAILVELSHMNRQLLQPIQVRIGIHTGLVVVGEIGGGEKRERLAMGDTLNIASRVQNIAEPNTVVITSNTYRLIRGFFTCNSMGFRTLKGISQPMEVYQVLHESGVQSRFEIAISKGLTPLIGREQEIGLLLERWERVREGRGQVVLLSGDAGIGKSRLVQVLKEHVAGDSHTRIESFCSSFHQNSTLYPVIVHLQQLLQFRREDSQEEKLGRLEMTIKEHGFPIEEIVPLFASLLSFPLPDRYPPLNLSPQTQKQKTLEAMLAWLISESEKQPVLRIVEDLHWVDPSTLEYLSLLIDHVPTARIFILLTFRSDFSPPWPSRSHLTQITLNRLTRKQVEVLIERVTGGRALPDEVVKQVVTKTDGVPLFVEELTKMVLESGLLKEQKGNYILTDQLPPLAIPATLQDSLMARLDRLAIVKDVVQMGATFGREFTYELLKAVSPLDEVTLQRELNKLVKAEILYQRGFPPKANYFFKHALIQESAYHSILKSKRQQYHQKIAKVLEERFLEIAETQPELLAYHYTETNQRKLSIPYWLKAGQRATEHSAYTEAISHLTKGLEVLKTLPDTPEKTRQELTLQITLGSSLRVTKGFAAPVVEIVYARARELSQQIDDTPQLFPVLRGLCGFYIARAEFHAARELGEQCLRLAQSVQDVALLIQSHYLMGGTLLCLGEPALVIEHLEQAIALYSPQHHSSHTLLYGQDPGVDCLCWTAWALWYLGYPDQALRRSQEALTLAQELSHPYSIAIALDLLSFLHQLRREELATKERAEASINLSTERGFEFFLDMGTVLRGWALAKLGYGEEGIEQIRQGMAALRETGAELFRTYYLSLLAEAYDEVGQTENALTMLTEALDTANKNGERFHEAELYRLKGEMLIKQAVDPASNPTLLDEAEICFNKALEVARHQCAKSLELRALMSLSRLWQKKGKIEESREMLAEIYTWFTEGSDTRDLKEAKSLLEELS